MQAPPDAAQDAPPPNDAAGAPVTPDAPADNAPTPYRSPLLGLLPEPGVASQLMQVPATAQRADSVQPRQSDNPGQSSSDEQHTPAQSRFNPVDIARDAVNHIAQTATTVTKDAVDFVRTRVRAADENKAQLGALIDSGKKHLESQVDDARAWLREHGGIPGQTLSAEIGVYEGAAVAIYDAGKGVVQLADGALSLVNPLEWLANPDANIERLKSVANGVETLGKLANLATPAGWMTTPKENAQLASALWNSAASSFEKDPAKFTGQVAGTILTMAVPAGEAAVAGNVGRTTEVLSNVKVLSNVNQAVRGVEVAGTQTLANAGKIEQATAKAVSAVATDAAKVEQGTATAGKVGAEAGAETVSTAKNAGAKGSAGVVDEALASLNSPATRHYADKVTQSSVAKEVNTVVDRSVVDMSADVAAIRSGQAQKIGDTFVVNGRTYGMHDGTLYPMSGPGLYTLDRGSYKALGILNKFGNTPQADVILKNMGVSAETKTAALKVFEVIKK